jgi:hypothetical protein
MYKFHFQLKSVSHSRHKYNKPWTIPVASSGRQSGSLRGQEDPSPVPPQCAASVPASAVVEHAVKSRRTKGGKSVNLSPSGAAWTWQSAAMAIVIISIFAFVFFAAVVVVVGSTLTRSAPRRVSFLLLLPDCCPFIFDCRIMSHPPPAHPRQTDFSFMSLPPPPPPHHTLHQLMWLSGRLMLLVAEVRGSIPCKTPRLE